MKVILHRLWRWLLSRNAPTPEHLWRQYSLAFALLFVLVATSHVLFTQLTGDLAEGARTINDSGRQRMLMQRTLYLSELVSHGEHPELIADLKATVDLYEDTESRLIRLADGIPAIAPLYFDAIDGDEPLIEHSAAFIVAARAAIAGAPGAYENLRSIIDRGLAERLSAVVTAFERDTAQRGALVNDLQVLLALAMMIVLALEALFIFAPAYFSVRSHARKLRIAADAAIAMRDRQAAFASVSADLLWELDMEGTIVYLGGRMSRRLGRRVEGFIGQKFFNVVTMRREAREKMYAAVEALQPYDNVIARYQYPDGTPVFLELAARPNYDQYGRLLGYLGVAEDVSDRIAREALSQRLAEEDPLTAMLNRRAFFQRLDDVLAEMDEAESVCIMAIDLDGFKPINDLYGHDVGDAMLRAIAVRLNGSIRSEDWAARFGGDEFIVALRSMTANEDARAKAALLIEALKAPIVVNGKSIAVGASIGVSDQTGAGGRSDALLKKADQALYHAKRTGRNKACLYSDIPETDDEANASGFAETG